MKLKSFNGEVEMRKTDHQLQQGLYITRWEKAGGKNPYDAENTGYTFAPVKYYEPYVASTPTSCQRSEEHTSELQSPCNLVCRLLLEKKNTTLRSSLRCAPLPIRSPPHQCTSPS